MTCPESCVTPGSDPAMGDGAAKDAGGAFGIPCSRKGEQSRPDLIWQGIMTRDRLFSAETDGQTGAWAFIAAGPVSQCAFPIFCLRWAGQTRDRKRWYTIAARLCGSAARCRRKWQEIVKSILSSVCFLLQNRKKYGMLSLGVSCAAAPGRSMCSGMIWRLLSARSLRQCRKLHEIKNRMSPKTT